MLVQRANLIQQDQRGDWEPGGARRNPLVQSRAVVRPRLTTIGSKRCNQDHWKSWLA